MIPDPDTGEYTLRAVTCSGRRGAWRCTRCRRRWQYRTSRALARVLADLPGEWVYLVVTADPLRTGTGAWSTWMTFTDSVAGLVRDLRRVYGDVEYVRVFAQTENGLPHADILLRAPEGGWVARRAPVGRGRRRDTDRRGFDGLDGLGRAIQVLLQKHRLGHQHAIQPVRHGTADRLSGYLVKSEQLPVSSPLPAWRVLDGSRAVRRVLAAGRRELDAAPAPEPVPVPALDKLYISTVSPFSSLPLSPDKNKFVESIDDAKAKPERPGGIRGVSPRSHKLHRVQSLRLRHVLDRAVNATESAIGIRLSDPLRDKLRRRLRRLKFFNLETVQDIARRAVDFAWGDPEQILRPQFPPRGLIVPESPPWADPRRPGWGHWTAWDRAVVDWFSEALAALWSREPAFLEILDWVRENVLRTAQCAVRGTR